MTTPIETIRRFDQTCYITWLTILVTNLICPFFQVPKWKDFDKASEWFVCEREMRLSGGMATVRIIKYFMILKEDRMVALRAVNAAAGGPMASPKASLTAGLATASASAAEAAVRWLRHSLVSIGMVRWQLHVLLLGVFLTALPRDCFCASTWERLEQKPKWVPSENAWAHCGIKIRALCRRMASPPRLQEIRRRLMTPAVLPPQRRTSRQVNPRWHR